MPGPLPVDLPVLAAPMAGGPSTPELVVAAAGAGGLGFLAAGYRSPEELAAQIAAVRDGTGRFGVNVFAANPVPVDPAAYRRYRDRLLPLADRHGVELPATPREDDDAWAAKLDLLRTDPVPVASFTFGVPSAPEVAALRRRGTTVLQTVTDVRQARAAVEAGVDGLIVQAAAAGGHSGTLTPDAAIADVALPELLRSVASTVDVPLVAAGGVAGPADVSAALAAGAVAVAVGTLLLLTPEAGTSAIYRATLAGSDSPTVLTRAFSGRPARALVNGFVDAYDREAPAGYPAIHHLTSPLRRAATAAGDAQNVNLWAGTGYRAAREQPAAEVLRSLAG